MNDRFKVPICSHPSIDQLRQWVKMRLPSPSPAPLQTLNHLRFLTFKLPHLHEYLAMFFVPPAHRTVLLLGSAHREKPVLSLGDQSLAVVDLQRQLLRWRLYSGYPAARFAIAPDELFNGRFTEVVKAGVESFQAAMFLPVDGVVNSLTWQALYAGAPIHMPQLALHSTGDAVKTLQTLLLNRGDALPSLGVDGVYRSSTEWAVRHFQKRVGLPVTGIVSAVVWYTLSRLSVAIAGQRLPILRNIDVSTVDYVLSESVRDFSLEGAIVQALGDLGDDAHYYYNRVDLNGDGIPEVLACVVPSHAHEPKQCSILVFQPHHMGYRLVTNLGRGTAPVVVLQQNTQGWNDLLICSHDRYGMNYWYARFNGTQYEGGAYTGKRFLVPDGEAIAGTAFVADEMTAMTGLELPRFRANPWLS